MAENSTGSLRASAFVVVKGYPLVSLLFIAAVLTLAVTPARFWGDTYLLGFGATTLHNGLIVLLILPYFLRHRLRGRMPNLVIIAFGILAITSFTLATRHPSLSAAQTFKSLAAYLLGAVIFEINITTPLRRLLQWTLPALATLSLLLGLAANITSTETFYRVDYTTALRLQGATIPSHLAMLALVGMMVSARFAFSDKRQLVLFLVNFGIVTWTGTRAAMIAAAIVVFAWVIADIIHTRRTMGAYRLSRTLVVAALSAMIFVSYLPELVQRMSFVHYEDAAFLADSAEDIDESGNSILQDTVSTMASLNTSGRLTAWRYYLEVALENPFFGRGVGAGTVAAQGVLHPAFARAPHNEYIRLLVDGGILGLVLVVLAYMVTFRQLIRQLPLNLQILAFGSFAGFAFLGLLDNVLSTQQFAVPFWLYLALLRVGAGASFAGDGSARDSDEELNGYYRGELS